MDLFEELFGEAAKVDPAEEIKKLIDSGGVTEEVIAPLGPSDRVRASSIEKFCPRFEALRHRDGIHLREKVSGRLNRIFSHGRIFERALRDQVFGPLGILVGAWRCLGCDYEAGEPTAKGAISKPESCLQCGCLSLTYVEPFGMAGSSNVGGSGDGFILWKGEKVLLEIKTAKAEIFREVAVKRWPLPDHVSQTQVYLEVFKLKHSLVWYYNKNTSEHLPIWTSKSDAKVQKLLAKGSSLADYFQTRNIPDRLCENATCSRAKECTLRDLCFQGP